MMNAFDLPPEWFSPPSEFSLAPFWFLNDDLDEDEVYAGHVGGEYEEED